MKVIRCEKVMPQSGCKEVMRGKTEEEVLKKAGAHAEAAHGAKASPEMMQTVRGFIEDEK